MLRKSLVLALPVLLAPFAVEASDLTKKAAVPAAPVKKVQDAWSGVFFGLSGGYAHGTDRAKSGCEVVTGLRDETEILGENLCAADVIGNDFVTTALIDTIDSPNNGTNVTVLEIDENTEALAFISEALSSSKNGGVYGAQFGYNSRLSNGFVLGGEISAYKFSNVKNSYNSAFEFFNDGTSGDLTDFGGNGEASFQSNLDWLTKATVRIGLPILDDERALVYGAVGGAVAHVAAKNNSYFTDDDCDDPCVAYNKGGNFFQFGAVFGGGLEYLITDNMSLGLEYNYIRMFGAQTLSTTYAAVDGSVWTYEYDAGYDDLQLGLVKLNYRF